MNKILIVDDEEKIRNVLVEYAHYNNFDTECSINGQEAVDKAISKKFDCIIMDIMMPELDGFEASKIIRRQQATPIVLISAKSEEYDILKGFELGIDDYIVKPFSPREVIARVKAILARTNSLQEVFCYKSLEIDINKHSVCINNNAIKLTNKEYDILLLLLQNKNKVISREEIIDKIYKDDDIENRTIDAHIKMLRKDLCEYGDRIQTVRGVGYKFDEE